jgi:hypothetical protein
MKKMGSRSETKIRFFKNKREDEKLRLMGWARKDKRKRIPVRISTRGYRTDIVAWQCRHLALSRK